MLFVNIPSFRDTTFQVDWTECGFFMIVTSKDFMKCIVLC